MPEPRVAIGMPWAQWIPGQAVASFVPMVTTTLLQGRLCDVFMSGHNILSLARELIVTEALNAGATHLLFMDADIVPPPDLVNRLLRHSKPVVSALYRMRNPPHPVVCFPRSDNQEPLSAQDAAGAGLLKVFCVGMGACLINAHVLRTLRGTQGEPLFEFFGRQGEDLFFANRCEKAGIGVYLDRDTVCGHVGTSVVEGRPS